ncbi:uncharacterized protein MONBRDRAFT_25827 [Monosiga brevicollis MX1]|uniref:PX domain-containing protein n=1 Tax=Monosiga brevicollis TaxID=81824 RepID=A9V0J7_MONBE|nr:uncharacterized protein MONBRDRAFT_25827 [Monosiga brevicollis MX1]EDQ89028.1 predicted protein [Monosiga brevicollis MX1]|eukprot:XP_001746133.1 hypothetical protein [Monosiga brevicollis MX1]
MSPVHRLALPLLQPEVHPVPRVDKRVSGALVIDEKIQTVISLLLRDYLEWWFKSSSDDQDFVIECERLIHNILIELSVRCKEIDVTEFVTTTVVDVLVKHIRLYRATQAEVAKKFKAVAPSNEAEAIKLENDRAEFFVQKAFNKQQLKGICTKPENELNGDYINSFPACLLDENLLSYQAILDVANISSDVQEIKWMLQRVEEAIQATVQSQDEGTVRQSYLHQMEALLFAQAQVANRYAVLTGRPRTQSAPSTNSQQEILPLKFILRNSVAIVYFEEFMLAKEQSHLLAFWREVSNWRRKTFEARSRMAKETLPVERMQMAERRIKEDALRIFFLYLTDDAEQHIAMPLDLVAETHELICQSTAEVTAFDQIHATVQELLHSDFYPEFLKSDAYDRCLYTLKFDDQLDPAQASIPTATEPGAAPEASGPVLQQPVSAASATDGKDINLEEHEYVGWWSAELLDHEEGEDESRKSFTVYVLKIRFQSETTGEIREWICKRRYSEFDNFTNRLKGLYPDLKSRLNLPKKKLMGRKNSEFVEKRQSGLRTWLKELLSVDTLKKRKELQKEIAIFLREGTFEKTNVSFASKVLGRHRTTSIRSEEEHDSDEQNLTESLQKDNLLSILLRVAEVVFELNANPWLRRRVMGMLETFVTATYGSSINRKVGAAIDAAFAPDQVAAWVTQYQEATWPNDTLAVEFPPRTQDARALTRLEARLKLLGCLPDEVKGIIGRETAKRGVMRYVDFADRELNSF